MSGDAVFMALFSSNAITFVIDIHKTQPSNSLYTVEYIL